MWWEDAWSIKASKRRAQWGRSVVPAPQEAKVGRSSSLNGPLRHSTFERSHSATLMLGLEDSLQSFYDLYKFPERGLVSDWALSLSSTD